MTRIIDDLPVRELIIAQAKKNEPGFSPGAFKRNGRDVYHYYENGILHVVTSNAARTEG